MRTGCVLRDTKETKIDLALVIDGERDVNVNTGCGFLDHMLTLFAYHGRFGLKLTCVGDTYVDFHHTTEDVGIALGSAFKQALGDMRGITRYGSFTLPMDETLVIAAVDISGRSAVNFDAAFPTEKIGAFDTELVKEFMLGFSRSLGCSLHLVKLAGENSHHIAEAMYKALGRAMKQAVSIDKEASNEVPSTKGCL